MQYLGTTERICTTPPVGRTTRTVLKSRSAIHRPSGDQTGSPQTCRATTRSRPFRRTTSSPPAKESRTNAIERPSGERLGDAPRRPCGIRRCGAPPVRALANTIRLGGPTGVGLGHKLTTTAATRGANTLERQLVERDEANPSRPGILTAVGAEEAGVGELGGRRARHRHVGAASQPK